MKLTKETHHMYSTTVMIVLATYMLYHVSLAFVMETKPEIQNYLLPFGSLGHMGYDSYGPHGIGNGSHH